MGRHHNRNLGTSTAILTINTHSNPQSDTAEMDQTDHAVLLGKFMVPTMTLETVQYHFNDIHPCLMADVEYTAEDLVGAELWAGWTPLGQRQAHLCLKHLATLPGSNLQDMAGMGCDSTGFQIA